MFDNSDRIKALEKKVKKLERQKKGLKSIANKIKKSALEHRLKPMPSIKLKRMTVRLG